MYVETNWIPDQSPTLKNALMSRQTFFSPCVVFDVRLSLVGFGLMPYAFTKWMWLDEISKLLWWTRYIRKHRRSLSGWARTTTRQTRTYVFIIQATHFYKNHPNPFSKAESIRKSIRDVLQTQDKFGERANGVLEFLENPWFHRACTFQEVHLSKEAEYVCGKFTFSWMSLVMVMMFMFHLGLPHFEPARGGAANFVFSTYLASRYGDEWPEHEEGVTV